jgi:hypothetical protein
MKVQAEQEVQWMFGGPQASSCVETNIVVIKASPVHPTKVLVFYI